MNLIKHPILPLDSYSKKNYKYKNVRFDYILKKDFEEYCKAREDAQEPEIIGYFAAKAVKAKDLKDNADVIALGTKDKEINFLLHKVEKKEDLPEKKLLGYALIGPNQYVGVRKKSLLIPLIPILVGLAAGIFTYAMLQKDGLTIDPGLNIINDPEITGTSPEIANEVTDIPVYTEFTITAEKPYIRLINPEGNTVYFEYEFLKDGTSIYKSNIFPPGRMIETDLNGLSQGDHHLEMIIHTYDMETEMPCSSATEPVVIHVK